MPWVLTHVRSFLIVLYFYPPITNVILLLIYGHLGVRWLTVRHRLNGAQEWPFNGNQMDQPAKSNIHIFSPPPPLLFHPPPPLPPQPPAFPAPHVFLPLEAPPLPAPSLLLPLLLLLPLVTSYHELPSTSHTSSSLLEPFGPSACHETQTQTNVAISIEFR